MRLTDILTTLYNFILYPCSLCYMKVLISEIPDEGIDVVCEETVESDTIISPIKARLKIMKIGNEVIVKGEVVADITLQCSRCVAGFNSVLSVPVDVVYHPLDELKREERHEILSGELDMDFYSGEEMDITTLMKEQMLLNIPMKPLCSDNCRGICRTCGKNLNEGDCSCPYTETDSRFNILKKILDRDKHT
jgi:uncharacterized protein